ncbi:N-6 DNA methylase, partial [bacterium]|nr:N-6 DNA methylase [bacterium]
MTEPFKEYFQAIKKVGIDGTEHSYRTAFENLLNEIKPNENIKIIHEPKREKGFGAPDFRIEADGAIIGYIETKKIEANLDEVLESNQLIKYLALNPNLILTNYHQFILIHNFEEIEINVRSVLFYKTCIVGKTRALKDIHIEITKELFHKFFLTPPEKIGDWKEFAKKLAERAKIVKEYITELLDESSPKSFSQRIKSLYTIFKETLIEDLKKDDFADAYSQTVVYGFFLAFLQSGKRITPEDANRIIQPSFKVIREFFNIILDINLPHHLKWIFTEISNLINNIDLEMFYKETSFKNKKEIQDKDPYLHFYETFLGELDPEKRKAKGVYFTPPSVVSFITRSIDLVLQDKFAKGKGFADPSVTVLDFATGTGTFLVFIFQLIFEKFIGNEGRYPSLIKDHLLENFYGFENLVAPYAITHLKLYQLLKEYGYLLKDDERLKVYLTDTLDDSKLQANWIMPALSEEGSEANHIKMEKKILIVTGNPPYNVKSKNKKPWITEKIDLYKPIYEKKMNWDDYIKFIRYAHWKIKESD